MVSKHIQVGSYLITVAELPSNGGIVARAFTVSHPSTPEVKTFQTEAEARQYIADQTKKKQ